MTYVPVTKLTTEAHRIFRNISKTTPKPSYLPFYDKNVVPHPQHHHHLYYDLLIYILGGLVFLGFLKALAGICGFRCIGELGLSKLIDLPRPIDGYREDELRFTRVRYDVAGWPLHPTTGKRTVRLLPANTEFFLNLFFFIAYPLALFIRLVLFWCCRIETESSYMNNKYEKVNIVKKIYPMTNDKKEPKEEQGPKVDRYTDQVLKEAEDLEMIINLLKEINIVFPKLQEIAKSSTSDSSARSLGPAPPPPPTTETGTDIDIDLDAELEKLKMMK